MRAEDLVGVWIAETFHLVDQDTGGRTAPWGEAPRGVIVFHPAGRMVVILTAGPRRAPADAADRTRAFDTMLAYSGAYRVDPPNRLVTEVDMAWFEPWIGTEQLRYCRLDGDAMTLTSAPLAMPDGGTVHAVVTWRRDGASKTPH